MTNQEAFTKVRDHLLKQNARSMDEGGNCLYRGPRETKCAVGCLIPDEEYSTEFENKGVISLPKSRVKSLEGLSEVLLTRLQYIHDKEEVEDWERELRETAAWNNLIWE